MCVLKKNDESFIHHSHTLTLSFSWSLTLRTVPLTWYPCSNKDFTRCSPKYPVAPVTVTIIVPFLANSAEEGNNAAVVVAVVGVPVLVGVVTGESWRVSESWAVGEGRREVRRVEDMLSM